jgi:hypothetical protein
MKSLISTSLLSLLFIACAPSIDSQIDKAESIFIDEVQYMTKKEALSNEINYYKEPEITTRSHKRSLTGKDLIHECNRVMDEDNGKDFTHFGPTTFKIIRRVDDIKDYAIEHPNDVIAEEFYFEGTFTHYNNGYGTRKAIVIYVPKLDRYIIDQIYR